MPRSIWVAVGASVLVFTLIPAVAFAAGPGSATSPARAHADSDSRPAPIIDHIVGISTPALAQARPPEDVVSVRKRHRSARLAAGSRDRQVGSTRVVLLQRRLSGLGFSPGPIDGRYGPLTAVAVEGFQTAAGLAVDGIPGPRTLATLAATTAPGLFPGGGYGRAEGSRRVRALQRRLTGRGFSPGPVDGRYGPLTALAVRRFQRAHSLRASGVADVNTLRALGVPGGRPALVRRRPRANLSDHRYPRGDSAPQGDRAPQGRRAPNGHRAPTGHRAPNNHHVPERLRTPSGHSANPTVATPADLLNSRPALPVIPVLLGLGAAGLAAMALSYSRARRHRAIITDSPQADPASPAKAAPRVRPMPRQGQVARVPEVHPPRREVRPVPLARVAGSVLTRGRRERSPALPVASALVATAGLGLGLRRLVRRSRQRRTEQRRTQARDTRTLRAVLSAVGGGVKQTGGRR